MSGICLLGGAGYLGHHLALALKAQGQEVSIVDSFSVNNLASWITDTGPHRERSLRILEERIRLLREAEIPLITMDARNYHGLSRVLDKISPAKIVHLCAISHAGRSNADRHAAWEHTLVTLKNALDYAIGAKVEQFVFQSSSLRYGNFNGLAKEDQQLRPKGWYGSLKVAAEVLVHAAEDVHGLPVTITVPSALYGPRCVSRRVVQIFVENCLEGKPLEIAGDGEEKVDFTYVDDWTDGMLRVLSKPEALHETFNLTCGEGRSLNDLVFVLRKHFPNLTTKHTAWDQAYPSRDGLCIEKAKTLLGYQPRFPLESGLCNLLHWYYDSDSGRMAHRAFPLSGFSRGIHPD